MGGRSSAAHPHARGATRARTRAPDAARQPRLRPHWDDEPLARALLGQLSAAGAAQQCATTVVTRWLYLTWEPRLL